MPKLLTNKIFWSSLGFLFTVAVAENGFFIKRLVDKVDETIQWQIQSLKAQEETDKKVAILDQKLTDLKEAFDHQYLTKGAKNDRCYENRFARISISPYRFSRSW